MREQVRRLQNLLLEYSDLKTIEMDADAFSCSYLAGQFCDIDSNEEYALNYFAEETESKLTILISSITILFFLLDSHMNSIIMHKDRDALISQY